MDGTLRDVLVDSYLHKTDYVKSFPVTLSIEPTNHCNLKCIMCPQPLQTRPMGLMQIDLFKKIIDESAGKTEFIWLHFMGESLLHKNIFEMIEYASAHQIYVGLSTNATIIHKHLDKLRDASLAILILCIDGVDKFTYEKVRVGANYEQTVSNIKNLVDTRPKYPIIIQLIDLDETKMQHKEFVYNWRKFINPYKNVYLKIKNRIDWAGQMSLGKQSKNIPPLQCVEPYRALVIRWDGKVVPCCNDYNDSYVIGDLRQSSIREIWNNDRMQQLRASFRNGKHTNLCKSCEGSRDVNGNGSIFHPYENAINCFTK